MRSFALEIEAIDAKIRQKLLVGVGVGDLIDGLMTVEGCTTSRRVRKKGVLIYRIL